MIDYQALAGRIERCEIKALSIKQPYPHHIFHDGKDVENRDWATRGRGWFIVHAGISKSELDKEDDLHQAMPRGGVVGAKVDSPVLRRGLGKERNRPAAGQQPQRIDGAPLDRRQDDGGEPVKRGVRPGGRDSLLRQRHRATMRPSQRSAPGQAGDVAPDGDGGHFRQRGMQLLHRLWRPLAQQLDNPGFAVQLDHIDHFSCEC